MEKITKNSIVELTETLPADRYHVELVVGTKLYVWSKKRNGTLHVQPVDKKYRRETRIVNLNQVKLSKDQFKNTVKVDDIFYSSWGYGQTNIDFYQVVKVLKKSVEIIEIDKLKEYDGPMNGTTTPVSQSVKYRCGEKVNSKRVKLNIDPDGNPYFKVTSYASAHPYKGGKMFFSEWH